MNIHVSTGNRLDVVFEYHNHKKVLLGIKPHDGEFIPLPDPKALAEVLLSVLKVIEEYNDPTIA